MRFASRFLKYTHGCRDQRNQFLGHTNTGNSITTTIVPELVAQFSEGKYILADSEIEIAMKKLRHKGLPINNDTQEPISPRYRISGYDTELAQVENGWTDEERKLVEKSLLESPHLGSDHILLEAEKALKPWPTYDEDSAEQIVLIARATGFVEAALAYERENLNRDEIVSGLTEGPEVEAAVVVNAS